MYAVQARLASGRSFLLPSDDPVAANRVLDLTQALQRNEQYMANLAYGDNVLAAADDAISDVNSLLIDAQSLASKNVGSLTSADERRADAELIAGIRQQLQSVGNRQFDGRYIFAGRDTTDRPFVEALGGVAYVGDTGDLITRIEDGANAVINMPGNVLFGALSSQIAADVDLTPALSASIRLDDIGGTTGFGIRTGLLVFNDAAAGAFTVDLTSADTIGDIAELINDAAASAGSSVIASLSSIGMDISPAAGALAVTDNSGGAVAGDLGIYTPTVTTGGIVGADLNPCLTRVTPVEQLAGGAGIDLTSGMIISNGPRTVTLDFAAAETVQDVINIINNAGVYVLARINDAGTGIDVFNRISGTSLSIGENGGTTATDFGVRTYSKSTRIAGLNSSTGITLSAGEDDMRVTAKDGSTFDVNVDDAETVGDVIDLINAAATDAGVAVTASSVEVGNGMRLVDSTGGSGALSVTSLNQSAAATDLGLLGSTIDDQTELVSEDRNPTHTDGVFSALVELEAALRADDTNAIALAGARLAPLAEEVTRNHGIVGAQSQSMRSKLTQMEDTASSTEVFLSEVRDLDYAEAVTQMEQLSVQLQVSMQANSRLLGLSLMDFLA